MIERALSLSKEVLVLVGGKGKARSARNPFTFVERYNMIKRIYPNVKVCGISDHTYNDAAWIEEVQQTVKKVALGDKWTSLGMADLKIGLIGCEKDHTSYYLKLFPEWGNEGVEFVNPLNATDIRREIFEDLVELHEAAAVMDVKTCRWIFNEFKGSPEYTELKAEYDFLIEYRKKYGEGPHVTADSLVRCGGSILLVTRGGDYAHGKLAMPGGFLNKNETFQNASIRELREETKLRVPVPVLKGSIKGTFLADAPYRDERGHVISMVQHIVLENETKLPEVRGTDDAKEAGWFRFADLTEDQFAFDHYHIIKKMSGL